MNSLLSRDEQAQESTLSHLTGTLIGQISKLARQEVALAKAEVKQVAHKSARDGVGIVAGPRCRNDTSCTRLRGIEFCHAFVGLHGLCLGRTTAGRGCHDQAVS